MKNFRHMGIEGHGGRGSRAMQAGSAAGDGDEHQVPPSRPKARIIAWKSGAGFFLGGSAHGLVLEAT